MHVRVRDMCACVCVNAHVCARVSECARGEVACAGNESRVGNAQSVLVCESARESAYVVRLRCCEGKSPIGGHTRDPHWTHTDLHGAHTGPIPLGQRKGTCGWKFPGTPVCGVWALNVRVD